MSATSPAAALRARGWMPDFCSLPILGSVVALVQLIVVIVLIAPGQGGWPTALDLFAASFLAQWIALVSAALLCKLGPWLGARRFWFGGTIAMLVPALVAVLCGGIAISLDRSLAMNWIPAGDAAEFLTSTAALAMVIAVILLRYIFVLQQWQRGVEAHAAARIETLQARIRPHFLFNSLNAIASLIRIDADKAESAVEDLASVFRATLREERSDHTLADELEVIDRYLAIEALRLGERLQVHRTIEAAALPLRIPALSVQPLVENAIHHGVQALPRGGTISISAQIDDGMLRVRVHNPKPAHGVPRLGGNHIALGNIRERLRMRYGGRALLEVDAAADYHAVTLRIPIDENPDR
jgi:two-component system sensor histidine kinase AlgZ